MVRIHCPSSFLFAVAGVSLFGCGPKTGSGIPEDVDPVTTESGMTYSVLAPGMAGRMPQVGDWVRVHYTGWLEDGTRFASTGKGEPFGFMVGKHVAAWNEAVQLMKPGARFKVTAPSELAYGARGNLPAIPPHATLIFDLELVSVTPGPPFVEPDPEEQEMTESGLVYEVLEPGEGEPPSPDRVVELSYALWNTDGRLLRYTPYEKKKIKGKPGQFHPPVLAEAASMMPLGARYLFEAPAALAFGDRNLPHLPPRSTTIWEVTMVDIVEPLPLPPFVSPDDLSTTETSSGIRYSIVEEGRGERPRPNEVIELHYVVWLPDGTRIDSSYAWGRPLRFRFGSQGIRGKQVIPAWNRCVALLKRGTIARFVVPPRLAFGASGRPPDIGPDQPLVLYLERPDE